MIKTVVSLLVFPACDNNCCIAKSQFGYGCGADGPREGFLKSRNPYTEYY